MQNFKKREVITAFIFSIYSILGLFFVIMNTIEVFPLLFSTKYDYVIAQANFFETLYGKVVQGVTITDSYSIINVIVEGGLSFLKNQSLIVIITLIVLLGIYIMYFYIYQPKSILEINKYKTVIQYIIYTYLLKYLAAIIIFGIAFLFNSTLSVVPVGYMLIGISNILFNLVIAFFFIVLIIKFFITWNVFKTQVSPSKSIPH